MHSPLEEIIETFASVDAEMRIELLLDYAKRLPELPERFHAARAADENRVHECMTPVYLFVEEDDDDGVAVFADVARESPTIAGFVSLVIESMRGATRIDYAQLPGDLAERLRLTEVLRMNRAVGLAAVIGRIRNAVLQLGKAHVD
ncbi:MAG: SufE family protein [Phycisphaerales bacterium]